MTKEEYEEIKANLNSDDPLLKLEAQIIVSLLPTYETKYKFGRLSMDSMEKSIKCVLQESEIVR